MSVKSVEDEILTLSSLNLGQMKALPDINPRFLEDILKQDPIKELFKVKSNDIGLCSNRGRSIIDVRRSDILESRIKPKHDISFM